MAKAGPDKVLGMKYAKVWKNVFGKPLNGRYGKRADFKNQALLSYAYQMLMWDGDVDEVKSYLPKSLHYMFDTIAIPEAEKRRQGYVNDADGKAQKKSSGKAKKVREHGASTAQEQCENSASTVQALCEHCASTDEDTQPPAETSDLGSTQDKAKSNANAELIKRSSSIKAKDKAKWFR